MFCSDGFAPMWVWFAPMVMCAVCSNVASIGLLRCGCGLLQSVYHGSGGGMGLDRCCGFGLVLLWLCLVIVVVGGGFWQFFVFLFLFVVVSYGCCWW